MARRKDESTKFTVTWKIENFNFHRHNRDLKSHLFHIRISEITSWYLSFENYDSDSIEFFLNKKEAEESVGEIGYQIEITDDNGKILYFTACERCSFIPDFNQDIRYSKITDKVKNINVNTITVHCLMILPEPIIDLVYACKARTRIEAHMYSFKWAVENFLTVDEVSKEFFCSPRTQIKLTLSKTGIFVSIVIKDMKDDEDVFVTYKIALLDMNGIVINSRTSEYSFYEDGSKIWKFPHFTKSSDLFSARSKYVEYNNFSLMCEISISDGAKLEEIHYCPDDNSIFLENNRTIDSFTNLHKDFRRMYIEHLQTDVKLQVGKQSLLAHKGVLSTRSPVFAPMFGKDMLEIWTEVVDIPNIEIKILDLLIRFMYDGTVDNLDYDSACKLLIAAEDFQVIDLKEICSTFLMSNLNAENACDILILSDKLSHEVLKSSALNYIVKHVDVILPTEIWSHFVQSNIKLVEEVMMKLSILNSSYKNK